MWKKLKRIFAKDKPVKELKPLRNYRTYQEIEEDEAEIEEMLILSDPSWVGNVARKHHG
uniref:Uncharacterized protein n=1 Tax=viral metagenome TaxID=1070528 RepID=A0A6M3JQ91_9ZZZZ